MNQESEDESFINYLGRSEYHNGEQYGIGVQRLNYIFVEDMTWMKPLYEIHGYGYGFSAGYGGGRGNGLDWENTSPIDSLERATINFNAGFRGGFESLLIERFGTSFQDSIQIK